ncbi:T9SS type A sorting domain-containing protein [Robertkochia aurantiaca]|uniref:T9SS type A sorting domain-containing protein n=1 Tax=Robertkochia aurantiaca TaxID=2873700 RepID=UPI001CCDCB74|nr:T9SS type A sorting domain-containing protein [Robertkochia sp. 3YJGBD-33]
MKAVLSLFAWLLCLQLCLSQDNVLVDLTINYQYNVFDTFLDGTGTCHSCYTKANRYAYYGLEQGNDVSVIDNALITSANSLNIYFYETRDKLINNGREQENFCHQQVTLRDEFSRKQVNYCEARTNKKSATLNLWQSYEYGNDRSIKLDDPEYRNPLSYSRVWLLPNPTSLEYSATPGYCDQLFRGTPGQVEGGHWEYLTGENSSWKTIPDASYATSYPLNITVEELDQIIEEDLKKEEYLKLRFILNANGSGSYNGWNSKEGISGQSNKGESRKVLHTWLFRLIPCSIELDYALAPNPMPVNTSCYNTFDGGFKVVFERELKDTEKINLNVVGENEERYAEEITAADLVNKEYEWKGTLMPGNYYLEWITLDREFANIPDAPRRSPVFTVTSPDIISLNTIVTPVTCEINGSVKFEPTGGTPPFRFSIDGGLSFHDRSEFTIEEAKSLDIIIIDSQGCQISDKAVVNDLRENPVVTPVIILEPTTYDGEDGSISVYISGGTEPYQYHWSKNGQYYDDGSGLIDIGAGTYELLVTDAKGCVSEVFSTFIAQPDPLSVAFSTYPEELKCSYQLSNITAIASGGVTDSGNGYIYRWDNGQTGPNLYNMGTGNYGVTVYDKNGNSHYEVIEIRSPSNIEVVFDSKAPTCYDERDGEIYLEITGGTSPYSIEWYSKNMEVINGIGNWIDQLGAGSYHYRITDANGCILENFSDPIILEAPEPLVIQEKHDKHIENSYFGAEEGSFEIQINKEVDEIVWYKDDEIFSAGYGKTALNMLAAGKYVAKVIEITGCKEVFSDPIHITEPAEFIINQFRVSDILCPGSDTGAVEAMVSGGVKPYNYKWFSSSGDLLGDASIIDGLYAGSYRFVVTDNSGSGIRVEKNFEISEGEPLQVSSIVVNNFCYGARNGEITLKTDGREAAVNFIWEDGFTGSYRNNLASGWYEITAVDGNGCDLQLSVEVKQPETALSIVQIETTDVSTFGGNDGKIQIGIDGGNQPYEVEWRHEGVTIGTGESIEGLTAGVYQLLVTDSPLDLGAHSCLVSEQIEINEPLPLSVKVTQWDDILCHGDQSAELIAEVTGGVEPYYYKWFSFDGVKKELIHEGSEYYMGQLAPGIYVSEVSDINGNTVLSPEIAITQPELLRVDVIHLKHNSCFLKNEGELLVEIVGGVPPYTWFWNSGDDALNLKNLKSGEYVLEVFDANNCYTRFQSKISNLHEELVVTKLEVADVSRWNGKDGRIEIEVGGGAWPYSVNWFDHEGNRVGNGFMIDQIEAGRYQYEITDNSGCVLVDMVEVRQPDLITYDITHPTCLNICDGSISVTVNSDRGVDSILWSNGSNGNVIYNLCSGVYKVTIQDFDGVVIQEEFTLESPEAMEGSLEPEYYLCKGESLLLDSGLNDTDHELEWILNGEILSKEQTFLLAEAGNYTLRIYNSNSCYQETSFKVVEINSDVDTEFLMTSQAGANEIINLVDVSLPAPGNISWEFPEESVVIYKDNDFAEIYFQQEGFYEIGMTADYGHCQNTVYKKVQILEKAGDGGKAMATSPGTGVKKFSVYPNPTDGIFNIEVVLEKSENISVKIFQLANNALIYENFAEGSETYNFKPDASGVNPGMYAVVLQTESAYSVQKLIMR